MKAAWLALLAALCLVPAARAADGIVVQSAFVNVRQGAFELTAHTIYPLNEDVRAALAAGATINLELQATVARQRRYWFDATLVDVTLHRELSWHAVSRRYILIDVDRGGQQSFAALDQALAAAGQVEDWPILSQPALEADATYSVGVRASIRRGRLPEALRALLFWTGGWNRSSEWYRWILPR